ncbi:MAG: superoxide dismutase family protein [Planctomycetales bacterium]|nr:superoxide dismutase family protein [Planctomycetales bacterium]
MTRSPALLLLFLLSFIGCDLPPDELSSVEPAADSAAAHVVQKPTLVDPQTAGHDAVQQAPAAAICLLQAVGDSQVSGTVRFRQVDAGIHVSGEVRGLSEGKHGFHVHEFGDLSDMREGKSAGGHFNPGDLPHGHREDEQRHVGDLGNIEAGADGVAKFEFTDRKITLAGSHSILGHALVVHAGEDKFTQPSGDAGGRVAVGVIGVAKAE